MTAAALVMLRADQLRVGDVVTVGEHSGPVTEGPVTASPLRVCSAYVCGLCGVRHPLDRFRGSLVVAERTP